MKYEVSRSNTFRVIALQRSVDRQDRRTDGRTDRRTDKVITIGLPHLRWRGPRCGGPNKANTSDKETSFLDLNIKVIGSDVHTSVYDKRDDFGFPIVNFPWLSGDVPRLPSHGVYISQLVRFARCCTSVSDFKNKTNHPISSNSHPSATAK